MLLYRSNQKFNGNDPLGVTFFMGYSIAAPVKSYVARDKMLTFLEQEYKTWPELYYHKPKGTPSYLRGPLGADLSYYHGKCYIGFDYNAASGEREYAFSIVRWIALKIGKQFKKVGMPYYNYDGDEVIGIVTTGDCIVQGCDVTTGLGVLRQTSDARKVKGMWQVLAEFAIYDEPDALDVIRAEMQRLDTAWAKFKLASNKSKRQTP